MRDVSFHLTLIKKLFAINAMPLFYTHYFELSFYRYYDITISTNASDVIQYNNITPFIRINAMIRYFCCDQSLLLRFISCRLR